MKAVFCERHMNHLVFRFLTDAKCSFALAAQYKVVLFSRTAVRVSIDIVNVVMNIFFPVCC